MLSSIFLSGVVGDFDQNRDDIRFVEIHRVVPCETGGTYDIDKFPVIIKYSGCPLIRARKGQMIVVKGRLEYEKDYGLVIVEELSEIYTAAKK